MGKRKRRIYIVIKHYGTMVNQTKDRKQRNDNNYNILSKKGEEEKTKKK